MANENEQQHESSISGGPCWSRTPAGHSPGKETLASVVKGSTSVLTPHRANNSKCCFILFTPVSNLYRVHCREFQTEYLLCDCNILWMHRWVKERNITVRDTRCVYPKSLQAQPVTGVKQELLTCGKGEGKTGERSPSFTCPHVFLDKL